MRTPQPSLRQLVPVFVLACLVGGATASSAALRPDLVVQSVDVSDFESSCETASASGTVRATVRALNAPARRAVSVLFYSDRNADGAFDPLRDTRLCEASLPSLAPGADATVECGAAATLAFRDAPVSAWVDASRAVTESDEDNNVGSSLFTRVMQAPVDYSQTTLRYAIDEGLEVTMTPVVARLDDSNADGRIDVDDDVDIIFVRWIDANQGGGGYLRKVRGRDGAVLVALENLPPDPALGAVAIVRQSCTPTIADLDGDGVPEVIAPAQDGQHFYIFDNNLRIKHVSDTRGMGPGGDAGPSINIANLDGAGAPEIIANTMVFDKQGRFLADGGVSSFALVSDIDRDGLPEIVTSSGAFRFRRGVLSRLWTRTDLFSGFIAVANLDDDPEGEIVITDWSGGSVRVINHDGSNCATWNPPSNGWVPQGAGRCAFPSVADYDGDGAPEIAVVCDSGIVVSERDGTIAFSHVSSDETYAQTGSCAFDFDMDGALELVARDRSKLWIIDGRPVPSSPGRTLFTTAVNSGTIYENPVVVDLDDDGHAEVLTTAGPFSYSGSAPPPHGLLVFENPTFASARAIWNEHAYHVSNIADDASVPLREKRRWDPPPSGDYKRQTNPLGAAATPPDLTATRVRVSAGSPCGGAVTLTALIGNAGGQKSAATTVAFRRRSASGALLGSVVSLPPLAGGSMLDVSVSVSIGAGEVLDDAWVVADDDGAGGSAVAESDESNNACHAFVGRPCDPSPAARATRLTILDGTTIPPGAVAADYLDAVELSARLEDISGSTAVPVEAVMVDFELGSAQCRGMTQPVTGVATCWTSVADIGPALTLRASTPATSRWGAAEDTAGFTVTPEEIRLTFDAPLVQLSLAKQLVASATLRHDGAVPRAGELVTLSTSTAGSSPLLTTGPLGRVTHTFTEASWGPRAASGAYSGTSSGFEDAAAPSAGVHLLGPQIALDPPAKSVAAGARASLNVIGLDVGATWGNLPLRYAVDSGPASVVLTLEQGVPLLIEYDTDDDSGSDIVEAWLDLDNSATRNGDEPFARARVDRFLQRPVTITCTPTIGDCGDAVVLAAHAADVNGNVTGAVLIFELGSETCRAVTDTSGDATCHFTPPPPASPSDLTVDASVTFNGDATRAFAKWTGDFTVDPEEVSLVMISQINQLLVPTLTVTARARLTEDGGEPVANEQVTFTSAVDSATDFTDSTGFAEGVLDISAVNNQVTASYAGSTCLESRTSDPQAIYVTSNPPADPAHPTSGEPTIGTPVLLGDGAVKVQFTTPTNAASQAITGYYVEVDGLGEFHSVSAAQAASSTPAARIVTGLGHGTQRRFRVYAMNPWGASAPSGWSTYVTPLAVPAPPDASAEPSGSDIVVSWPVLDDGGDPILRYEVLSLPDGIVHDTGTNLSWTLTGAAAGTTWTFRARAVNGVGDGAWSLATQPLMIVTSPGPPTELCANVATSGAELWWLAPENTGGKVIDHYEVRIEAGAWTWLANGSTVHSTVSLTSGVTSIVDVRACNAASQCSDPASIDLLPAGSPSAPVMQAASGENAAGTWSWNAGASNGLPIAGYVVGLPTPGGNADPAVVIDPATYPMSLTVTGLPTESSTSRVVRAVDSRGQVSDNSDSLPAWPSRDSDRPTAVSAQRVASQTLRVTWTEPADKGRDAVTGYEVTSIPGTGTHSSLTTTVDIAGLVNGQRYVFFVRAANAVHPRGAESDASAPVAPWGPPSAPQALTFEPSGDSSLRATWTEPLDDGGFAINGYQYRWQRQGNGWSAWIFTASPAADLRNLAPGTYYDFEVSAVSDAPSDNITPAPASSSARAIGLPLPPAVAGTPTVGNGTATLTWTLLPVPPDASSGFTPIISYRVCPIPGDAPCVEVPAGEVTATVDDLSNGTVYVLQVQSRNAVGLSLPADSAPARPCGPPFPPQNVAVVVSGDGQLTVSWETPGWDGGCGGELSYRVTMDNGTPTQPQYQFSRVFPGLGACTEHEFFVEAMGSGLPSAPSMTVRGTAATVPQAPRNVMAFAGNERAMVCWDEPDMQANGDGCSPITGYVVRLRPPAGADVEPPPASADQRCLLVTGLQNGTQYAVFVHAVNVVDPGPDASPDLVPPNEGFEYVTPHLPELDTFILPGDNDAAPLTAQDPIPGGHVYRGSVSLDAVADIDTPVTLTVLPGSENWVDVPTSVTIPAGQIGVSFAVDTAPVMGPDVTAYLRSSSGTVIIDSSVVLTEDPSLPTCGIALISPAEDADLHDYDAAENQVIADMQCPGTTSPAYSVKIALADDTHDGGQDWTLLCQGSGETLGSDCRVDPTKLLNGMYVLRVQAGPSILDRRILISGQQKIGQFTVSYVDLTVPVAGMPIQVIRTYDSRDTRRGDFGMGWSMSVKDVRVEANFPISREWVQEQYGSPGSFGVTRQCVEELHAHVVTVTFPDGKVYKFKPVFSRQMLTNQPCAWWEATDGWVHFVPQGTTRATLHAVRSDGSPHEAVYFSAGDGYLYEQPFDPLNPIEYTPDTFALTTEDGRVWTMKVGAGLQSVLDLNGNHVDFESDGIYANNVPLVSWTRLYTGLPISQLRDPPNQFLKYDYDPGDQYLLWKVHDRDANDRATGAYTEYQYTGTRLTQIIPHGDGGSTAGAPPPVFTNYVDDRVVSICQGSITGPPCVYTPHAVSDLSDRKQTVTDQRNNTTTFWYDEFGRVTRRLGPGSSAPSETRYVDDDQPSYEIDPTGVRTDYTYELGLQGGNLLNVKVDNAITSEYTWGPQQRLRTVGPPGLPATSFEYDTRGNLEYQHDPVGHTTHYVRDTLGAILSTTDALNHTSTATWTNGLMMTSTDARQVTTTYSYDANGNPFMVTTGGEPDSRVTLTSYDANDRPVRTEQPDGSITETDYDAFGRVAVQRDYADSDPADDDTTVTPRETKTFHVYAGDGSLTTFTQFPDHTFTETRHDLNGNVTWQRARTAYTASWGTPPDGIDEDHSVITQHAYDGENRLRKTCWGEDVPYPASGGNDELYPEDGWSAGCTFVEYDDAGRVTWRRDERGAYTLTEYDSQGRPEITCGPLLNATDPATCAGMPQRRTTAYDEAGRVWKVTEHLATRNIFTIYRFDGAGRKVAECRTSDVSLVPADGAQIHPPLSSGDPDNDVTCKTYEHDALGRVVAETDALGHVTRYGLDEVGRLASVTDALDHVTSYGYDDSSNMTRQEDAKHHVTLYEYDAAGRRTARILPLLQRETIDYTLTGALRHRVDFMGRSTLHDPPTDRMSDRDALVDFTNDPTVTYEYYADGTPRVVAITGGEVVTYDREGVHQRLRTITHSEGTDLRYEYDAAGNRTSTTTDPNGTPHRTTYGFDAANRLDWMCDGCSDPGGLGEAPTCSTSCAAAHYEYASDSGRLTGLTYGHLSGTSLTREVRGAYDYHDVTGGLTAITWTAAVDTTPLLDIQYRLDEAGRREAVTETWVAPIVHHRHVRWSFDDLGRLTDENTGDDENNPDVSVHYEYDEVGNRRERTRTGPNAEDVTSVYDDNDRLSAADGVTLQWDQNGNLLGETPTDNSWDDQDRLKVADGWAFTYDAEGLKQVADGPSAAPVKHVVDASFPYAQVIEDREAGSVTARYMRGFQPVRIDVGANSWWYLNDAIGSTRALVKFDLGNGSALITDTWDYEAFGTVENAWSDPADGCGPANRWLFAGEESIDGAGTYLRNRWMRETMGRFISADPMQQELPDGGTVHQYQYAGNRPHMMVDPGGLWTTSETVLVGALVGVFALSQLPKAFNRLNWSTYHRMQSTHDEQGPRSVIYEYMKDRSQAGGQRAIDFIICIFRQLNDTEMPTADLEGGQFAAKYVNRYPRTLTWERRFGRTPKAGGISYIYAWSWEQSPGYPFENDLELTDTVMHELYHQYLLKTDPDGNSSDHEDEARLVGIAAAMSLREGNSTPKFDQACKACKGCQ